VNFVYDGDGDAFGTEGPEGSAEIEALFTEYFAGQGIPTAPTAFDGRSDYFAFINAGIPAGGLFTGAEGVKTAEEAALFGGTSGEPYDPCYHQACDTIDNVDDVVLGKMGDAVAHAVFTLGEVQTKWLGFGHGQHGHGWGDHQGLGDLRYGGR
jgi:Zn-dependent M28 family amino/carboxypeptidase